MIPLKPINDEKVKKEIEEFNFFVQYGNFKELENYKEDEKCHITQKYQFTLQNIN